MTFTSGPGRWSWVALGALLLIGPTAPVVPAEACPVCGGGFTAYFEWQCIDDSWEMVLVGEVGYGSCSGAGTLLWGYRTDCFETIRGVGGGTQTDPDRCNEFSCTPEPSAASCISTPPDPGPRR